MVLECEDGILKLHPETPEEEQFNCNIVDVNFSKNKKFVITISRTIQLEETE